MADVVEVMARALARSCYDGCEDGDDVFRACCGPPCPCRNGARAALSALSDAVNGENAELMLQMMRAGEENLMEQYQASDADEAKELVEQLCVLSIFRAMLSAAPAPK